MVNEPFMYIISNNGMSIVKMECLEQLSMKNKEVTLFFKNGRKLQMYLKSQNDGAMISALFTGVSKTKDITIYVEETK